MTEKNHRVDVKKDKITVSGQQLDIAELLAPKEQAKKKKGRARKFMRAQEDIADDDINMLPRTQRDFRSSE